MLNLKLMCRSLLIAALGLGLSLAVVGCGERDEPAAPDTSTSGLPSYDEVGQHADDAAEQSRQAAEQAARETREAAEKAAREAEEAAEKAAREAEEAARKAAEEAKQQADDAADAVRGLPQ